MSSQIDRDLARAREILKGKVRKDLKKFITHGEMVGRQGRRLVTIPVPSINEPRFRHGNNGRKGVSQGEGEVGQPIGTGGNQGDGEGQAGSEPGSGHTRDVEVSLEELADMLAEELKLPRLKPRSGEIVEIKNTYKGLKPFGISGLMSRRKTMREAILRSLSVLDIDDLLDFDFDLADNLTLAPRDKRYRSIVTEEIRAAKAAIIFMMDVSGSMTQEQKELVRREAFWIEVWVRSAYPGVEIRYIIHDAVAKEVDENAFYHTHESGGTRISSAYQIAKDMINPASGYPKAYNPEECNIYIFQFSDGDNWGEDNETCINMLKTDILPVCSLFGYSQVKSPYGSGDYIKELKRIVAKFDNLTLAEVLNAEAIYPAIKALLDVKEFGK